MTKPRPATAATIRSARRCVPSASTIPKCTSGRLGRGHRRGIRDDDRARFVSLRYGSALTHVYTQFAIAPRIELISEESYTAENQRFARLLKHLVFRPNREVLGTGAAISEFLARGPCTILLDELDHVRERSTGKGCRQIWNFGHERRGAETSLMEGGRRKYCQISTLR